LAYPFSTIPFNSYKLSISLFLSEFLYFSVRGEHEVGALYQYVENSIRWLDSAEGAFANFHLVFMMHLTRFIGFYPNLENWHSGDFFDLRNGVFCSLVPLHPDFIPPNEAAKIGQLMRMNYETMHLFRFSREERNRCANLILRYYRLHIPSFPELKSLSVLQDLFR
ncbi:MAG: DNA repair protein RecO C-terminal domain-containing protein, partial [Prevotella buccalis]|nr:DNA repair protein RecO C-terminal domain-containing protein [Hoylesella buccalis]